MMTTIVTRKTTVGVKVRTGPKSEECHVTRSSGKCNSVPYIDQYRILIDRSMVSSFNALSVTSSLIFYINISILIHFLEL
jgi:hypothetical protein